MPSSPNQKPLKTKLEELEKQLDLQAQKAARNRSSFKLVLVSKNASQDAILEAYNLFYKDFAENRIENALTKIEALPKGIRWHFIGKIQSKKIKKILGKFDLIHSVDSYELAEKISVKSKDMGLITNILLQANTSSEKSKSGLSYSEWIEFAPEIKKLDGICIQGLMTMAPQSNDETIISDCFKKLFELRDELEPILAKKLPELSMGMSQDYPLAIRHGSSLLRIGSAVFS